MSITAADLGTNSVRFACSVHDLLIGVITASNNAQGNIEWDDNETAGLAGVVTVAKAKTLCGSSPSCSIRYGTDAVINRITLNKYDAKNRDLWVTYVKNVQSSSAPRQAQ